MAGGVKKRGSSWAYFFEVARVNGQRKKKEKSGFKSKREAEQALLEAMHEYNNVGRTFTPTDISVADYLDYWLENAIRKNIDRGYSYNTYIDYERKIRIHIKPAFGQYRLNAFQYAPDLVQNWVDDLKAKGLSKSMVKNTLTCLSGAMNYAILPLKYIQANPCTPVKVGKMPQDQRAKEHTEYVLSKDDYARIIDRFPEGDSFHLSLLVPYHIGTRISETFAIDLSRDVDFEKHTIAIQNQMLKVDRTWYFKNPKYDSMRTVPIGETLEKALKAEITRQKKNRLRYGSSYLRTYILPDRSLVQLRADMPAPYTELMPLCVKDNGALMTPESFKYCARVVHYELGNPLFHSHSLRHTHGTILAECGVNPRTVMERLGHKDIETTLQTYTFNTAAMQQSAVDAFERSLHA